MSYSGQKQEVNLQSENSVSVDPVQRGQRKPNIVSFLRRRRRGLRGRGRLSLEEVLI